jgi:hypothetical protein
MGAADGYENSKGEKIRHLKKLKRYIGKIKEKELAIE